VRFVESLGDKSNKCPLWVESGRSAKRDRSLARLGGERTLGHHDVEAEAAQRKRWMVVDSSVLPRWSRLVQRS
jgi:hypothetical protein